MPSVTTLIKPFMIGIGIITAVMLVSFRNQETIVEYATLKLNEGVKTNAIVFTTSTDIQYFNSKFYHHDGSFMEVINNLAKDGWRIVSSNYTTGQAMNRIVYLERTRTE